MNNHALFTFFALQGTELLREGKPVQSLISMENALACRDIPANHRRNVNAIIEGLLREYFK